MKRFNLHHLGRFGNNLFGYAFARGYCERNGLELHTDPWIGEKIFELSHPRCVDDLSRMEEVDLADGRGDISFRSYAQQQKCADYYTVSQCRSWMKFRPEIIAKLEAETPEPAREIPRLHLRRGDLIGYSYPVVSKKSYYRAMEKYLGGVFGHCEVSDDHPWIPKGFAGELEFLPDFYELYRAGILFRANSSFSFWAGVLGHHDRVFSPVIDGLKGGVEHDAVEFVEGLWPRLSDHDFVSEIRIAA